APAATPAAVAVTQPEAGPAPAWSRTYTIEYLPSKGKLELPAKKKAAGSAETYDQISADLEQQIAKLLTNRGLIGAPSATAAGSHKVMIGFRVAWIDSGMDPLKRGDEVHLEAIVSVADSNGNVVFEKKLEGRGTARESGSGAGGGDAALATEAASDLVRNLDRDAAFTRAFSSPAPAAGTMAASAPHVPAAGAGASAPAGFVVLPAGMSVMLTLDRDVDTTKARAGDPVNFTLAADVRVGNAVVAKAGTKVAGSIFELPHAKTAGIVSRGAGEEISADLRVRIDYMALGDRLVRFRGGVDALPAGWAPGAELLEKVETHREMSMNAAKAGVHVHIKAGTMVKAFTAEDVRLAVAP
ncbi:MAG: hypothetical protein ACREOE_18565, partial [Gemmatimonadales bacterium]